MNNTRHRLAILLAAGAMLLSAVTPAAAQGYLTLDSRANRALNRQIINRAILRQAQQGRGSRSHHAASHRSRRHTAKRHHS